mgnify:CR=1 FL=1
MHTIKLQDGTLLENLELNGNNFISDTVINNSVFENNLETVVITDDDGIETEYQHMRLMSNIERDGRSWIVLGEKSESEIKEETSKQVISDLLEIVMENGVI